MSTNRTNLELTSISGEIDISDYKIMIDIKVDDKLSTSGYERMIDNKVDKPSTILAANFAPIPVSQKSTYTKQLIERVQKINNLIELIKEGIYRRKKTFNTVMVLTMIGTGIYLINNLVSYSNFKAEADANFIVRKDILNTTLATQFTNSTYQFMVDALADSRINVLGSHFGITCVASPYYSPSPVTAQLNCAEIYYCTSNGIALATNVLSDGFRCNWHGWNPTGLQSGEHVVNSHYTDEGQYFGYYEKCEAPTPTQSNPNGNAYYSDDLYPCANVLDPYNSLTQNISQFLTERQNILTEIANGPDYETFYDWINNPQTFLAIFVTFGEAAPLVLILLNLLTTLLIPCSTANRACTGDLSEDKHAQLITQARCVVPNFNLNSTYAKLFTDLSGIIKVPATELEERRNKYLCRKMFDKGRENSKQTAIGRFFSGTNASTIVRDIYEWAGLIEVRKKPQKSKNRPK